MNTKVATGGQSLVVGLGSPDRGDDAIGPLVAGAIEALGLPGLTVAVHEDPTALLHLWAGVDEVVVVDAVVSGGEPGSLIVRDAGADSAPLPASAWAETGRGGTHAFGLATAVELGRTLGKLPRKVTVIGVEAQSFDHGAPLSAAVCGAVDVAVAAVLGAIGHTLVGGGA